MDGFVGYPLFLVGDLPGQSTVYASLVDPLGTSVLANALAMSLNDQRWLVAVDAERVTVPGFWRLELRGDALNVVTDVAVGHESALVTSMWAAVLQAASQYDEVAEGRIDAVTNETTVVVSDLGYGEQYWRGRFLTVHPEDDLGNGLISRRIVSAASDGSLTINAPFPGDLVVGSRCAVLPLPVQEVIRALGAAVAEYGKLARVPVTAHNLGVDSGLALVPRGWTHVLEVWADGTRLRDTDWNMVPGRRIRVPQGVQEVTLRGLMPETLPSQPTGGFVVEPTTLVAYAGAQLHSSRAGGPGVDIEEHLRRHVMLMQLADAGLPRLAGRVPHGAREVLP